jgi:hypothetical protein
MAWFDFHSRAAFARWLVIAKKNAAHTGSTTRSRNVYQK